MVTSSTTSKDVQTLKQLFRNSMEFLNSKHQEATRKVTETPRVYLLIENRRTEIIRRIATCLNSPSSNGICIASVLNDIESIKIKTVEELDEFMQNESLTFC